MQNDTSSSRSTAIGAYIHTFGIRTTAKQPGGRSVCVLVGREFSIQYYWDTRDKGRYAPPSSQPVLNTGPQYRFPTGERFRFKLALSLLHPFNQLMHAPGSSVHYRLLPTGLPLRFLPRYTDICYIQSKRRGLIVFRDVIDVGHMEISSHTTDISYRAPDDCGHGFIRRVRARTFSQIESLAHNDTLALHGRGKMQKD
jgi:hypothetical protein